MTQNFSKNNFINYALSKGYSARDINTALKDAGMGGYNPLTYSGNIQKLPSRVGTQAKELGRDLTTLGGAMVNSVAQGFQGDGSIKDKFLRAINSEPLRRTISGAAIGAGAGSIIPGVGTIGGALLGGSAALLGGDRGIKAGGKDLVNALLSTYNTNIDQIKSGNVDWRDIAQGAMDNPLYAGLDILSFGGAKALGKTGKALAGKGGMGQKLLPGAELAELNRRLTNAKLWASQNTVDVYKGYNKLIESPMASRKKIVEDITGNKVQLTENEKEISNLLKQDLRLSSKMLSDIGMFGKDFSRDNTIAQYAMSNLLDTDLLHKDIMDIISGKKLRPTASKILSDKNLSKRVFNLIQEGSRIYDEGNSAFLSQRLSNTTDPLGEINARHLNVLENNPVYARVIGRASSGRVGNVLDETVKTQIDNATKVKNAVDIFEDIINNDMLGIGLDDAKKAKYIEVFKKSLIRDISQERLPNVENALVNSGIDTAIKKAGKPVMYEALKGFFAPVENGIVERFSNKFKKNVLGIPSWSVGNRLGNWSMNAIEGVTAGDYADVLKYDKLLPEVLKMQTSYNSYLGLGNEVLKDIGRKTFMPKSIAKAATEFKKSYGRYLNSDRTIADKVNYIFDTIGDIGNVTSSPIFELEAKAEYMDRAANFIRQAKRLAKDTGKNVEDILKQAQKDKELFFKLNTEVNKSLGDYFGRNYALPTGMQNTLRQWIPFYRFPVQTMRTTAHALANHPVGLASNVTIPARAGNVLSEAVMNYYNLDPNEYTGGVPYAGSDGSIRTMGMMPTPLGIVAPRLVDAKNFSGMLNPLFGGNVLDILNYKKFDKTPSSPGYTKAKATNPREALNYQPSLAERLMFAGNEILGTTYNPYIWGTRIAPQAISLARGEGRTPFYNTMQPIRYKLDSNGKKVYEFERGYDNIKSPVKWQLQNVEGYKKTTPIELLGGQLGLSTKGTFNKRFGKKQIQEIKKMVRNTNKNIDKNR